MSHYDGWPDEEGPPSPPQPGPGAADPIAALREAAKALLDKLDDYNWAIVNGTVRPSMPYAAAKALRALLPPESPKP